MRNSARQARTSSLLIFWTFLCQLVCCVTCQTDSISRPEEIRRVNGSPAIFPSPAPSDPAAAHGRRLPPGAVGEEGAPGGASAVEAPALTPVDEARACGEMGEGGEVLVGRAGGLLEVDNFQVTSNETVWLVAKLEAIWIWSP